jgi:hypothetical protein
LVVEVAVTVAEEGVAEGCSESTGSRSTGCEGAR